VFFGKACDLSLTWLRDQFQAGWVNSDGLKFFLKNLKEKNLKF
jgi:hypothetical protein